MSGGPPGPVAELGPNQPVVIDACSLINLVAAGTVLGDLANAGCRFYIVEKVRTEALFFLDDALDDVKEPPARKPIDSQGLIEKGVLRHAGLLSDAETALLVELASENLHDGEAASAAVALSRAWILLSDDRRVQLIMKRRGHGRVLLTTPDVLRHWSLVMRVSADDLRGAISRVERCARFRVPRNHPQREWWEFALCGPSLRRL